MKNNCVHAARDGCCQPCSPNALPKTIFYAEEMIGCNMLQNAFLYNTDDRIARKTPKSEEVWVCSIEDEILFKRTPCNAELR